MTIDNGLPDEMITNVNMLRTSMKESVLSYLNGTLIITIKNGRGNKFVRPSRPRVPTMVSGNASCALLLRIEIIIFWE